MMSDIEEIYFPGRRVCISGVGTDSLQHTHKYRVLRVTKTMIVCAPPGKPGHTWRFSRDNLRSLPRSAWGGTTVDIKCQKV